jgi:RNA polymerase sigma-70 factor (ECF subfamily)
MATALTIDQLLLQQKQYSLKYSSPTALQDQSQSLVEKCKAGDRKAQFELYQQYGKAMYNVCLRITNHETEAEDVLQEAFIMVFRKLSEFRGESTIGAWIKRIVVNTAINCVRKRKMDLSPLDTLRGKEDDTTEVRQKEEDVLYQVEQVKKAIQQLPDGFRVVISLYLLEGYEHGEIADILGIAESTSKSQYNRAKAKLREILANNSKN